MPKTFSKSFTGGGNYPMNRLLVFLNKNNLSPTDYRLMTTSGGIDLQTGYELGINITCIYYAENELF